MKYIPLLIPITIFLTALRVRLYFTKSRPSDIAAIEAFAVARSMRIMSICRSHNHWRYWLRGKLLLSNVARIFIVIVESAETGRHELHIAFDNWFAPGTLQLLQDIPIAR